MVSGRSHETFSHETKKRTGNLSKVVLGDKSVPVTLKRFLSDLAVLELAESVLVDNVVITRCLEQAGGNPRLKEKPLSKVSA